MTGGVVMSKMLIDRALLEQALEELTNCNSEYGHRCTRCDSEIDEGGKVAAALRAALAQEEQREQDARAEQIMSEIWAQPDQTYEYIGAKLAENMKKAMKNRAHVSVEAVRFALAQEEQEPVAWMNIVDNGYKCIAAQPIPNWTPLYTAPPRREWQRDELLAALRLIAATDPVDAALDPQRAVRVARAAIEAALKEKNT